MNNGNGWQIVSAGLVLAAFCCGAPNADQLPAPPSPHEQQCANIFEGYKLSLISTRDYFYRGGTTDRDTLAKAMIAFQADKALLASWRESCPEDARSFPPEAELALAYSIIAERFDDAK
jgi:hypothetical protein